VFHGLIQHSLALQLAERRTPFYGRSNLDRLSERFSLSPAKPAAFPVVSPDHEMTDEHSPLAKSGRTTIGSLRMNRLRCGETPAKELLPPAFDWAKNQDPRRGYEYEEPRFIFTDTFDDCRQPTVCDFLVKVPSRYKEAIEISETLFEVLAHKRSRLFGFALANRFVTVMLPHAIFESNCAEGKCGAWFMQPFVSFIRGGRDRHRLRNTYSLSLFFVPVEVDGTSIASRPVRTSEIRRIVNPGWGFAAVHPDDDALERFSLAGPLFDYLSHLSRFDLREMRGPTRETATPKIDCDGAYGPVTLRQAVEKIAFGVGLTVAQGSTGCADLLTTRRIGNDVVVSLGSARVSSVVVVDDDLSSQEVRKPITNDPFPGRLLPLMASLAKPLRPPQALDPEARKFRLDRPFDDDDIYATGVIPSRRCIVVVSRSDAQFGARESALMQAGSVGYMTLGAATAIGTLREIDKQLEHLEGAKPSKVAEIDREIAADLNEIYDLDITRESYRRMYRRLRDRLGITRDYETLQDEMKALHRATSTVHGDKAQRMLAVLTAAIVVLSVLILIGTLVLVAKPGG
jgi:hypothetical protein